MDRMKYNDAELQLFKSMKELTLINVDDDKCAKSLGIINDYVATGASDHNIKAFADRLSDGLSGNDLVVFMRYVDWCLKMKKAFSIDYDE